MPDLSPKMKSAADKAERLLLELESKSVKDPVKVGAHMIVNDVPRFIEIMKLDFKACDILSPRWRATYNRGYYLVLELRKLHDENN